jgi:hypothetical protein
MLAILKIKKNFHLMKKNREKNFFFFKDSQFFFFLINKIFN